jgi:hypothetical protein
MNDRNTMSDKPSRFEPLDEGNWNVWKIFEKASLIRKGVWGVVDGSITQPATGPNSNIMISFKKKQQEAFADIVLNLSPSQLPHISSDNPKELWDTLEAIHTARGVASRLTLRRSFWKLTKQPDQSMKSFIADARRLKHQLGDIGVTVGDEEMILVLTGGLPPSYDYLVVSLDATPEDDLTVEYVINRVLNEETRQENSSAVKKRKNVAFSAIPAKHGKRPVSEITCYCCNEKGHYMANCPKNPASANYKPEANTAYSSSATGDEDTIWS